MRSRLLACAAAITVLAAGCASGDDPSPAGTTSATTTIGTAPTSAIATTTDGSPVTQPPSTTEPDCGDVEVLAVIDAAVESARLAPGDEWSGDVEDNPYAARTASADEFAARLALDCGMEWAQAANGAERLVLAAWTGPRVAFVIQSSDEPSSPYRNGATVDVLIDAPRGEFLDGDERALWAGTLDTGETFVVGHVDYQVAPVAKGWQAGPEPPTDQPISLDAERHAIAALEEAQMRNIGIAELPEQGSEEGYVQFVSTSGQISAVDVAPTGWFDPLVPRFFTGPTRFETIEGAEVRVTEPTEDDNLGFTRGADIGWACAGFVWILEPPFNGDTDEMLATAEAILSTSVCRDG